MHSKALAAGIVATSLSICGQVAVPVTAAADPATSLNCKGCVGKKQLGKNAVDTKKVKDGSIKPADLSTKAQPGGVDFASLETQTDLSFAVVSIISVELKAPSAGYVVVAASWTFRGTLNAAGSCSVGIQDGVANYPVTAIQNLTDTLYGQSASQTRTFQVPKGKTTFYLNCGSAYATGLAVESPIINAMFFPQRL